MADRLLIYPVDDPTDWLSPTYFPESLERTFGATYTSVGIPGYKLKAHQFVGGDDRGYAMELLFDFQSRDGGLGRSDAKMTDPAWVEQWFEHNVPMMLGRSAFDPVAPSTLTGHPVHRLVLFDRMFSIDVIIRSATLRTVMFSEAGEPTRVRAELEMTVHDDLVYRNPWRRDRFKKPKLYSAAGLYPELPAESAGWVLSPARSDAEGRRRFLAMARHERRRKKTAGELFREGLETP